MGQRGRAAGGDQFYVTHCAVADSVLNNPGYTVRASSAAEPAALDAAFHYPPYELPIDLWKDPPPPALAPRRLARTDGPRGVWAVHSAYLASDTVGRERAYFSHLLLLPDADPAAVLRSWGADEWVTHYPPGAPKTLPAGAALPEGELVSDAALTAFLNDDPDGPTDLSLTVCPERLRADTHTRRELFARALHALLVLAEEESEARRRLYVHAEPGLVALLLYGCVRLLPPAVTDGLTFSTFEAHHRNLRDYRLAEVVGTYLGSPDRGLDPDLATTRGIALDTFTPRRSSAELRGELPDGVGALVELVAAGDWDLLPGVRATVGEDPSGLPHAAGALMRARGLRRADAGEATADDLLGLQRDPVGAEELTARAAAVWPVLKPAILARADVRAAFRELIARPEFTRELWEEAVDAVLKSDFPAWEGRWAAIREAAGADEACRRLDKVVNNDRNETRLMRLPLAVRDALRGACAEVGLFPSSPLLIPTGPGELDSLLGAAPPAWAGHTAFVLLASEAFDWLAHVPAAEHGPMRARARSYLLSGPPAALAAYVRAARPFADEAPQLLTALFTPFSPTAAGLMDGLLASGELHPADWFALYAALGLTQDEWGTFLLEKDRLANLLVGLGGDGAGREVWAGYLDSLTPALISPALSGAGDDAQTVHEWERTVHRHLRTAATRLTAADAKLKAALPDGGVARLFAADALVKWADDPATIPHDDPDEVPRACDAFKLDRLAFVRAAYLKDGLNELPLPDREDELAPVVELFQLCFPVDDSFNTARRAATEAIRLSADAPEAARGPLQAHLLLACVPDGHYPGLIEEQRQFALDPYAVARMRERLRGSKKGAKPSEPAPFEDEDAPADEEPVVAPSRKTGRTYKKAKGGCLGVVLVAAVLAALVVWMILGERGA